MSENFERVATVAFPAPSGHNVNMMPFVLGDASTIPAELHDYLPLLDAC